jgi:hypothetical protein
LLGAILGVLAGCGSSGTSSGTDADPALLTPASAPIYAGAIVRPEGQQKAAAVAAGRLLTHEADPYLRLLAALQTPGSPTLEFKRDVAPWLGPRAAVFLGSLATTGRSGVAQLLTLLKEALLGGPSAAHPFLFATGGVQGAIVLDTTDAAKARSFLQSQAARAGAHAVSYRGITYQATPGGVALGLVDRFAVLGSESGLRSVIDTAKGGPSLAHAGGYATLLASAPHGALAHLYANAGASAAASGMLALLAGTRETNVSLLASASSVVLDADSLAPTPSGGSGGLLSSSAQGAAALAELPGESWLAAGLGDLSASLGQAVQGLRGLLSLGGSSSEGSTSSTLNVKGLLEGLLKPLSVLGANSAQARRDFASWMGSAGIFAAGAGLLELKAGVVIASKDPALSRAAVSKLAGALRKAGGSVQSVSIPATDAAVAAHLTGLPVVLDIADGRGASGQWRFVLGIGEASVVDALNPSSTLSGSAPYAAAASALGEGARPSVTLDFPTLLSLIEGVGLSEDPTISQFVPYLRRITTLAGGGHSLGGGVERMKLVLGLQQADG